MRITLLLASILAFTANASLSETVAQCDGCHGPGGVSSNPDVPTIAGMPAFNTIDAFEVYKSAERPALAIDGVDMIQVTEKLDDDAIEEISELYAELEFVPAKQAFDEKLAQMGAKIHQAKCEKCHSEGGSLADDEASILAGQWSAYMKAALDSYVAGERAGDKKMVASLKALKPQHLDALVHYYASQQ